MGIQLDDLRQLLIAEDVSVFSDGEENLLVPFADDGEAMHLLISLAEDGQYIRWRLPFYLNLNRTEHTNEVLVKLMALNLRLKLFKFCLDPEDGEISVEIGLPLEDNGVTAAQVHRCLYCFLVVATQERFRLKTLMDTGVYPRTETEEIDDSVQRLFTASDIRDEGAETDPLEDDRHGRG